MVLTKEHGQLYCDVMSAVCDWDYLHIIQENSTLSLKLSTTHKSITYCKNS